MAYIKADHNKLKSTASAVETYADLLEQKIKTAKQDVQTLCADWQGADASQFQEKFNGHHRLRFRTFCHRKGLKIVCGISAFCGRHVSKGTRTRGQPRRRFAEILAWVYRQFYTQNNRRRLTFR